MGSPVLETIEITKHFDALVACDQVSLELREREIHAIIGPNGAGKSTLIKQICGGLKPDSGKIILNGEDVTRLDTRRRSRLGLGRTFQISALAMDDTALENVMVGCLGRKGSAMQFWRRASHDQSHMEQAFNCLERVGLGAKANIKTAELSHGERRQLEVAIALSLEPKAFIMDEPMAGLGSEGSLRMTDLLASLRKTTPIILVEHDMDAVFALADRISVLVYGRIIATGTIDEIRANTEVREAYLGDEA